MNIEGREIEGLRVDVTTNGKGEYDQDVGKIVFIHGMGCTSQFFLYWMKICAERGYKCFAVNLPGRCGSGNLDKPDGLSVRDYARAVEKVLREIGPAVVIGHSMGGLITQILFSKVPRLVSKAVLVAPASPRGIPLFDFRDKIMWRMWRPHLFGRLNAKVFPYIRAMQTGESFVIEPSDTRALVLNQTPDSDKYIDWFVPESGVAAREMARGLIDIPDGSTVPVLVLCGGKDKCTPEEAVRRVTQKYNARRFYYPNCGHMMMLEPEWQRCIDAIIGWLEPQVKKSS